MKKIYPFLTVLIIVFVVLWQIFFSNTNYYLVSVLIIIVSMQIGAFIGIATMCFFQINKGNGSSDKQ